jgi:6-pyruvoyltetrahydropterin/6-carboxytetrahydropterin synthase
MFYINQTIVMKKQYITRKGTFDSGHRVMNERMKCFNMHGHTYLYELEFEFNSMEAIGYAIDFKEIKRVGCQWIDDMLDHGFIVNPKDDDVIKACQLTGSKIWYMSLNGSNQYCNPSAENIAKEVFLAMFVLFMPYENLRIHKITLYETPNSYTTCTLESFDNTEWDNWMRHNKDGVDFYRDQKGVVEYDDRRINLEGNPKGNGLVDNFIKEEKSFSVKNAPNRRTDDLDAAAWKEYFKNNNHQ